jgi:hypothetical protein
MQSFFTWGVDMRDTIDMAREVKATAYTNRHYPDRTTYTFNPEQLKAFEALVRADERSLEREACAKVCEDMPAGLFSCDMNGRTVDGYVAQWKVAEDIRARGEAK